MLAQLQSAAYFIVLLGVLIFVHELGHFVIAKWMNVKVLRFSIGFGPKIVGFTRGETEYRISWIPIGGYVKMAGDVPEIPNEEEPPPVEDGRGFLAQPPWKRALIVAAGPAFNLLFPVLVLFCIYFFGLSHVPSTRLGAVVPGLPADRAGLRPGDRIRAVDGKEVRSFEELRSRLRDVYDRPVAITYERDGKPTTAELVPEKDTESGSNRERHRGLLGIYATPPPPVIGVVAGSAAEAAGFRTFDRVLSINGKPVRDSLALVEILKHESGTLDVKVARTHGIPLPGLNLQAPAMKEIRVAREPGDGFGALGVESADLYVGTLIPGSPAEKIGIRPGDRVVAANGAPVRGREWFRLAVERAGDAPIELTWKSGTEVKTAPIRRSKVESQDELGQKVQVVHLGLILGNPIDSSMFAPPQPEMVPHRLGAWESLRESAQILPMMIAKTAATFAYLLSGRLPLDMLGGPIAIYQEAGRSAAEGLDKFLQTMAFLSVNLGVLNLIPIPILDGFQLLAAGWEAVRRRPIPMRAREIANMIGLAMLFILMVIAFRNDLMR